MRRSPALLLGVAGASVVVDQWTKHWASQTLAFREPVHVIDDLVRFTYTRNSGIAFGMFAGREVTSAELDALGHELLEKIGEVSIIAEQRHEIGALSEASVHQVRVEVPAEALVLWNCELVELRGRLMEVAERWARGCIADRSQELGEASRSS